MKHGVLAGCEKFWPQYELLPGVCVYGEEFRSATDIKHSVICYALSYYTRKLHQLRGLSFHAASYCAH